MLILKIVREIPEESDWRRRRRRKVYSKLTQ